MKRINGFLLAFIMIFSLNAQEVDRIWTLEQCVKYAMDNNISIKQSENNIQLQETDLEQARTQFLPSVSGSAGLGISFLSPSPSIHDNFNNNFGISAGTTLYNGNRNRLAVESAKTQLDISYLDTEVLKNDLAIRVVNAYLNVLYNRESVKIAQEQVLVSQQLLDRMNEFVDAGVNARNDLFQSEATLATNEENLVTAQNNLEVALLELAQLLQIPYENFDVADVNIDISKAELKYSNSNMIYDKALNWRPEIMVAEKQIENADILIRSAKAGKLPVISASYSFGTGYGYDFESSLDQPNYFNQIKDGINNSLGVSLSVPIFDRFNTKQNTQRAKIQRDISELKLENQKILLQTEIERAYLDALTSLKTLEAAEKSVKAQEEAFRTAQERYNLGGMTSYDFEQVRNQLVQAQSSYIRAKYNYIFRSKFLEIYYGMPITLE